jgi:hypothetical protein
MRALGHAVGPLGRTLGRRASGGAKGKERRANPCKPGRVLRAHIRREANEVVDSKEMEPGIRLGEGLEVHVDGWPVAVDEVDTRKGAC